MFETLRFDCIYYTRTVQGHDPGVAVCPPTILFVFGCTVGVPQGMARKDEDQQYLNIITMDAALVAVREEWGRKRGSYGERRR